MTITEQPPRGAPNVTDRQRRDALLDILHRSPAGRLVAQNATATTTTIAPPPTDPPAITCEHGRTDPGLCPHCRGIATAPEKHVPERIAGTYNRQPHGGRKRARRDKLGALVRS